MTRRIGRREQAGPARTVPARAAQASPGGAAGASPGAPALADVGQGTVTVVRGRGKEIRRGARRRARLALRSLLGGACCFAMVAVAMPHDSPVVAREHPARPHFRVIADPAPSQRPMLQALESHPLVALPPASAPPAPLPPAAPLPSHQVFGFAPYWTLPLWSGYDLHGLTTVAYFGVNVNPNGTIAEGGSGWNGYQSQDLANLITAAHGAGDRVLLSAECFSQSALAYLTSNVAAVAPRLVSSLAAAIEAKRFDGVNLDFEGLGGAHRAGFVSLVAALTSGLRAIDPNWQVSVDTYGSSATDPSGFFDVPALASIVDEIFVMAYDMQNNAVPSPTAPLVGGGYNDTVVAASYAAVAPASKVILGVPFYGYKWPTSGAVLGASATGPPTPQSYAQIMAGGHPTYWDPRTASAWTSYQSGKQWYQVYFDNPTSLALKADVAAHYGLGGMGIWALGMDGNVAAMVKALLGGAPPMKDLLFGPPLSVSRVSAAPSTTAAPGPTPSSGSPSPTTTTTTINPARRLTRPPEGSGGNGAKSSSTLPSSTVPTIPSRQPSRLPPLVSTSSGGSRPLVSDTSGSSPGCGGGGGSSSGSSAGGSSTSAGSSGTDSSGTGSSSCSSGSGKSGSGGSPASGSTGLPGFPATP